MKEWRSKHGRIKESEIISCLTKDGFKLEDYAVLINEDGSGDCIFAVQEGTLFLQVIEDDDMDLSCMQYLIEKDINVFNDYEDMCKGLGVIYA